MAFEANLSNFTIYAYTVDLNQKVQPLNVNFLVLILGLLFCHRNLSWAQKQAVWYAFKMQTYYIYSPSFLKGRYTLVFILAQFSQLEWNKGHQ